MLSVVLVAVALEVSVAVREARARAQEASRTGQTRTLSRIGLILAICSACFGRGSAITVMVSWTLVSNRMGDRALCRRAEVAIGAGASR